jgi:hypothetical protein
MSEIHIEMIGGNCPLQAEGTIDGVPFYFRARGRRWAMSIGQDPVGILSTIETKPGEWFAECTWGAERFAAGWMPEDEAKRLIEWCAGEYAPNAASRSLELPPAAVLDPAAVSDRANEERLPEPPQWPRDGSP